MEFAYIKECHLSPLPGGNDEFICVLVMENGTVVAGDQKNYKVDPAHLVDAQENRLMNVMNEQEFGPKEEADEKTWGKTRFAVIQPAWDNKNADEVVRFF